MEVKEIQNDCCLEKNSLEIRESQDTYDGTVSGIYFNTDSFAVSNELHNLCKEVYDKICSFQEMNLCHKERFEVSFAIKYFHIELRKLKCKNSLFLCVIFYF